MSQRLKFQIKLTTLWELQALIFWKLMDIALSNFMTISFSRCPSSAQNLRKKCSQSFLFLLRFYNYNSITYVFKSKQMCPRHLQLQSFINKSRHGRYTVMLGIKKTLQQSQLQTIFCQLHKTNLLYHYNAWYLQCYQEWALHCTTLIDHLHKPNHTLSCSEGHSVKEK